MGKLLHEVMGWSGPMTDRQQAALFAFLRWRNDPHHVEGIDMDGCVPPETQERWARIVPTAKFKLEARMRQLDDPAARPPLPARPRKPAAAPSPGAPPVTPRPPVPPPGKIRPGPRPPEDS